MGNGNVLRRKRFALIIFYGAAIGLLILFLVLVATMSLRNTPADTTATALAGPSSANDQALEATGTALAATSDTLSTATGRLLATSYALIGTRATTATAATP